MLESLKILFNAASKCNCNEWNLTNKNKEKEGKAKIKKSPTGLLEAKN